MQSAVRFTHYLQLAGFACCAFGLGIYAHRFRSSLIAISSFSFIICTFSTAVSILMPIRFTLNGTSGKVTSSTFPPDWVGWLSLNVEPTALFVAGICILLFALRTKA